MNINLEAIFLQSLSWALVHAIWQITLLALLLALLLPQLKNARQKYWSAFTVLLLAFGTFLATFTWVFAAKFDALSDGGSEAIAQELFSKSIILPISAPDFIAILNTWLEGHTALVVFCWLLGFTVSLLRLVGGVHYLHRLQRNSHPPTSDYWQQQIATMAKQLGLKRSVELLESVLVRSPMALGYFKPIIFFPVGLLNHLSPAEVEAILAHELAHIARRDWLFNLVQAFIETLFYFHPAVWWISSVVRAERENCCDDTAVQLTGNRVMLAKALLHLQQLHAQNSVPVLALGAKGRSHFFHRFSLLTRIQRILNQPSQQKSLIMEKFVTTVFLLGMLALVGIRANGTPQLQAFKSVFSETPFEWWTDLARKAPVVNDSLPKPTRRTQKIVREEDGKRVEMEMKNGEVTRLNIDGQEIPAKELGQHRALTAELMRDMALPAPPAPPMPPVPPAPPAPGVPPVPPVPPIPADEGRGMGFFHGPGSVSRLSNTKDKDGNTLIRLERDGKPVEIIVKNGEVWVDGKRVETESSVDLSEAMQGLEALEGFNMNWNDNHLLYQGKLGADGNFYYHGDNESIIVPSPSDMELEALTRSSLDIARAELLQLERDYNLSDKEQAKHDKAMQKAEKEMRKAQKEMEKHQRVLEEQHRKMEQERVDMRRHRSAQ